MFEVSNLSSGYGDIPILRNISFSIREGEFVGILGHNGMGKTTLLRTLMGTLRQTKGKMTFNGEDLTGTPSYKRARAGIGYVPQGRGILAGLTVRDNLLFAAAAVGRKGQSALDEALEEFPRLKVYLDRPGGALSGGEQQLLALARTLVQQPKIVLLDEPTDGIQPSIIDEIVDKLHELRSRSGLTMLLVEQNVDFIIALSNRVLSIQKGMIVAEGTTEDLASSMTEARF